jgi:hypothetical protein
MAINIKTDLSTGSPPPPFNPEYKKDSTIYPDLRDFSTSISYRTSHFESPSFEQRLLDQYNTAITPETPISNPIAYRQNQDPSIPYQFPPVETATLDKKCLQTLYHYLSSCLQGFDPWIIQEAAHPIHNELLKICHPLLNACQNLPLERKISYLNSAIAELIISANDYDTAFAYTARLPKFELLEIALRNHLYHGLLYQEKSEIEKFHTLNKSIPNNLNQKEIALHCFVTKNNFYLSPNLNMFSILLQDLLSPYLFSCIEKATTHLPLDSTLQKNEEVILNQLKALELSKPSQGSITFEANLRDGITRKIITKLASQYRKEFQEKGTFNRNQMFVDIAKLRNFNTANGKFDSSLNIDIRLIVEIFELPMNDAPFASVRAKILQEKSEQLASPIPEKSYAKLFGWVQLPFTLSKNSADRRQLQIEVLAERQLETIHWVEKDWYTLLTPTVPPVPMPSAPSIDAPIDDQITDPAPSQVDPIPLQVNPAPLQVDPTPLQVDPVPLQANPPLQVDPVPLQVDPLILESPQEDLAPIVIVEPATPPTSVQSPLRFTAQDPTVPVISYIDIAFVDLLNRGSDQDQWNSLPPIVQKDVLRHVHYRPSVKGKAEDLARRIFKNDGWRIQKQVMTLNQRYTPAPATGLKEEFTSKGQELINFYYSDKIVGQFHNFINRFRELPKESRFYQYVYEMAKAANVHIESWDHHFAEYNWDQPGILHLSVQALERCLHTTP